MKEKIVTFERLQEVLDCDPETGIITRKITQGKALQGFVYTADQTINVDGHNLRVNRIVWAFHNGMWPPDGYWVDHKNGIKGDNRIANLRLATPTQNQQNKAGYGTYAKGVTCRDRKLNPFQAKIRVNGVRIHLGSFGTEEEAAEAYREACLKYHGEFACPT